MTKGYMQKMSGRVVQGKRRVGDGNRLDALVKSLLVATENTNEAEPDLIITAVSSL